jgi:transcriptional regulator of heat shock response
MWITFFKKNLDCIKTRHIFVSTIHIKVRKDYNITKNMKNQVTQKQIDWNKKFLKEEWNYCIRMINDRIEELDTLTLENYKEWLSQQHDVMSLVRNVLGKGYYFMVKDSNVKSYKNNAISKSFENVHTLIDLIEQNRH